MIDTQVNPRGMPLQLLLKSPETNNNTVDSTLPDTVFEDDLLATQHATFDAGVKTVNRFVHFKTSYVLGNASTFYFNLSLTGASDAVGTLTIMTTDWNHATLTWNNQPVSAGRQLTWASSSNGATQVHFRFRPQNEIYYGLMLTTLSATNSSAAINEIIIERRFF